MRPALRSSGCRPRCGKTRVLAAADPDSVIGGVVGLAHVVDAAGPAGACWRRSSGIDYRQLTVRQQLDYLRAMSLVFIRLAAPEPEVAARLAATLRSLLSDDQRSVEPRAVRAVGLSQVADGAGQNDRAAQAAQRAPVPRRPATHEPHLVSRSPTFAHRRSGDDGQSARPAKNRLRLFAAQPPRRLDARAAHFLLHLAPRRAGTASRRDAIKSSWTTSAKKLTTTPPTPIAWPSTPPACTSRQSPPQLPTPVGPGQAVHASMDSIALSAAHPTGRNFVAGKRAFAAARCVVCHRFDGDGGSTGPDLTQAAGRFTLRDLAESMVDPSKVVSDQYRATVIQTDGRASNSSAA